MEVKLTFHQYSEALKEDKLLGLECQLCGAVMVPPRMVCRKCASLDLEIITLSGKGKIKTFTTAFVAAEGRENELPYTIVLAEMDEGPWLMGNLEGIAPEKVSMDIIGRRVKLGHKVFGGDKYSAGEATCPLFSLKD
jgi:uncharacterized OB-fold protein